MACSVVVRVAISNDLHMFFANFAYQSTAFQPSRFSVVLQHPPTYTIGKRGSLEADFKVPPVVIVERGAEIHHIPRGGETTFHGPGQLVAYPILNLRRLGIGARAYVEGLEDVVIATLHHFGIPAQVRQSMGILRPMQPYAREDT